MNWLRTTPAEVGASIDLLMLPPPTRLATTWYKRTLGLAEIPAVETAAVIPFARTPT